MFESSFSLAVTRWAEETCGRLDHSYFTVWQPVASHFDPEWKPESKQTDG